MSAQERFHGPLADPMSKFVSFKRMQGYDYRSRAGCLMRFDLFLTEADCSDGLLHGELFDRYTGTTKGLAPSTREGLLSVVREFSRWLHAYRPESAVVPARILPRHCRNVRFYRLDPEQVRKLMEAAAQLRPERGIRPRCICFLIGLLYSTGLRIAEALSLNLGDLDTDMGTLFIRRGKFGKERVVAMTDSTLTAVRGWLQVRSLWARTGPSAPLLVGGANTRLTCHQARYAFRLLRRHCGLEGRPPPRLHDLRHNFACRCIARWRREGKDVQALLPVLANAMGHVNIHATQVYIHVEAAALEQASDRFRNHFNHWENRR